MADAAADDDTRPRTPPPADTASHPAPPRTGRRRRARRGALSLLPLFLATVLPRPCVPSLAPAERPPPPLVAVSVLGDVLGL
eukprot:CAMPEP_0194289274 /NCGR_PEP_ID=MMETSP0169-20130528/38729_1 /TAXON_ID=218684 /ORGANISM="Corethron pennatum, Strain L29A3" /LENGTH=81 /DNA_ID=CAMNT_0039036503 /DNA_START=200 /DNA_END=441 /DNA_ORIENTATION=-